MGSKADKAVFTVTGITLLTFLIASRVGSIWVLYPNVLIASALFIYCIGQIDEDASLLSNSAVFGLALTLTYLPMDWVFSRKARMIFYLRSDFLASVTTPIGVILNWVVFATLAAYCYRRFEMIFRVRFADASGYPQVGFVGIGVLAAAATGIGAAFGSVIIYGLGASHLWVWNAVQVDQMPQIASVPVFVPVSFLVTFLLCPYFFGVVGKGIDASGSRGYQHAGVAGIRCGIFMGALQFFSFLLFYVWK
ncbi:MAG: hypothetical protein OXI24_20120 [Candidatus Poribacteria bacterium]|nr:hypothetical protein [Candidatus Poribacteria bacterium]